MLQRADNPSERETAILIRWHLYIEGTLYAYTLKHDSRPHFRQDVVWFCMKCAIRWCCCSCGFDLLYMHMLIVHFRQCCWQNSCSVVFFCIESLVHCTGFAKKLWWPGRNDHTARLCEDAYPAKAAGKWHALCDLSCSNTLLIVLQAFTGSISRLMVCRWRRRHNLGPHRV